MSDTFITVKKMNKKSSGAKIFPICYFGSICPLTTWVLHRWDQYWLVNLPFNSLEECLLNRRKRNDWQAGRKLVDKYTECPVRGLERHWDLIQRSSSVQTLSARCGPIKSRQLSFKTGRFKPKFIVLEMYIPIFCQTFPVRILRKFVRKKKRKKKEWAFSFIFVLKDKPFGEIENWHWKSTKI